MTALLIANITVHDAEGYEAYRSHTAPIVAAYGGRFLVRGGAVEVLEGEPNIGRLVVLQFSSAHQARTFYHSPAYQEIARHRWNHATSHMIIAEGVTEPLPQPEVVDLAAKFAEISEHWRPGTVAELNGQEVKLARIKGEFPWHRHEVDELFLAWRGTFRLDFRDHSVTLTEGQLITVPAGTEHRPVADEEAEIILLEPIGTLNTGDLETSAYTAPLRNWL